MIKALFALNSLHCFIK